MTWLDYSSIQKNFFLSRKYFIENSVVIQLCVIKNRQDAIFAAIGRSPMNESLFTFFGIYFLCLFKFIAGPVLGFAAGYGFWATILVTVSGMMTSVFMFTFLGKSLKKTLELRFKRKNTVFSKRSRSIVTLWKKYGEIGIAFATPLFLTPIGGTLILVSFGSKKRKIFFHMFWSAIFWAVIFSSSIEQILRIPFFERLLG